MTWILSAMSAGRMPRASATAGEPLRQCLRMQFVVDQQHRPRDNIERAEPPPARGHARHQVERQPTLSHLRRGNEIRGLADETRRNQPLGRFTVDV